MLTTFVQALMSTDADAACGSEYAPGPRTGPTAGTGIDREWDTRIGTIDSRFRNSAKAPPFPTGCSSVGNAPNGPCRGCRHLLSARGVDAADGETRRAPRHHLNVEVAGQRHGEGPRRPGRGVPHPPVGRRRYRFVVADALTMKVRETGRVVNVACLIATGVNGDGHREILGHDVCSIESHAGWLTFLAG